jgi:hypothetical protein
LSSSDLAQWIGAIATALAVIVAIFTTLYFELIKPRRDRPKLKIHYDNSDPQCRRLSQSENGVPSSYYIRLKVMNTGKSPAQACTGRLVEIVSGNGRLRTDWDVSDLAWSAQPTPKSISLNSMGDHFFLDIGWILNNGEQLFRLRTDRVPRATTLDFGPGEYYFHVVIYAENAEPAGQWFRVNWNGEFDKFFMEKASKPNMPK